MLSYPFEKKPAFFPFVSSEVFFEARGDNSNESEVSRVGDEALDAELDKILGLVEEDK